MLQLWSRSWLDGVSSNVEKEDDGELRPVAKLFRLLLRLWLRPDDALDRLALLLLLPRQSSLGDPGGGGGGDGDGDNVAASAVAAAVKAAALAFSPPVANGIGVNPDAVLSSEAARASSRRRRNTLSMREGPPPSDEAMEEAVERGGGESRSPKAEEVENGDEEDAEQEEEVLEESEEEEEAASTPEAPALPRLVLPRLVHAVLEAAVVVVVAAAAAAAVAVAAVLVLIKVVRIRRLGLPEVCGAVANVTRPAPSAGQCCGERLDCVKAVVGLPTGRLVSTGAGGDPEREGGRRFPCCCRRPGVVGVAVLGACVWVEVTE